MLARHGTSGVRFGADGCDTYSSGCSSPATLSGPSVDSDDGSSSTDECCPDDPREFRRPLSRFAPSVLAEVDPSPSSFRPISPSFSCVLADVDKHLQRMVLLLPAFSAVAASAARTDALRQWLAGFDVGWLLDMDDRESLPRREVGRRIREWAQALGTMEYVFRHRHREVRSPVNDATAAALGQLAAESAGAMLRLAGSVVALGSSPSKLLAALDVHAPVSDTYPGLARTFSWPPSHPVSVASDAALARLLDASRRCVRDLRAFIREPQYPWRMPQGGEVHPCVGFWMGYFRCMLRNRVSLYFVLAGGRDGDEQPTTPLAPDEGGLVMDLISCLEAVLEEKSGALAFPGLRQIFMLNNTSALVRRATNSDLSIFLPPGWVLARMERMEAYLKGYLEVSWAPVLSCLVRKPGALSVLRRRNPLSTFYSALENVCRTQRGWKVPSPALRSVLRRTVSENVVPVYRRYLDDHPEFELPAGRSPEELEHQLSELFEG